jgi:putative ATP-binding cassette transporter
MKKQKLGEVIKRIWKIAAPYWTTSEEKWMSIGLLIINLLVMMLTTAVGVRMVIWQRDWTNAFTVYDKALWLKNIWVFLLVGASMIFTGMFNIYIQSWIMIRWRRWMTARYMRYWMANHNHYRMQLTGNETDNPDQRIAEDITLFVTQTWTFSFSLVQNFLTLGTYLVMLWNLSEQIPLVIGSKDISFPGYFIALAILWAAITTFLTHIVGKPLSRLTYDQQMYDANFRFSLVRFRENSEQIALLRGEDVEHSRIMAIFGNSVLNTFKTMGRTMKLTIMTGSLTYVDAMMFTLLLGPAYYNFAQMTKAEVFEKTGVQLRVLNEANAGLPGSGMTAYGDMMQVATAFQNVVTAFKWFQTMYAALAGYVAVIDRLYAFNDNYDRTQEVSKSSGIKLKEGNADEINIDFLDVNLPNGKLQISAKDLVMKHGDKILIKGRTGAGKTTLFRVLSDIWPYGKGEVSLPKNKKVIVLPQNPYFPIGTLEEAVSYPAPPGTYRRSDIEKALRDVGMPKFVSRIDEVAHWNMLLSGGEQQRIGIARAILYNPDYMFFDEATASMDEPSEEELYTMLLERMKDTTIISIGHRSSLEQFHKRLIVAEPQADEHYLFIEQK